MIFKPFVAAVCAAALALFATFPVRAQDEMPKDMEPPAPAKKDTGQAPPAPGNPSTPQETPGADQPPAALPAGTMTDQPWAVLQGLDKITARIRRLPIKVGQTVAFGTLSIEVDACRKAPPEDPPESAAFLKITEGHAGAPKTVFTGWMFASSPALSAMDHPVYDIWVVDCGAESADASGAAGTH